MAKKKRRRLKKSVKRGCALLIAVPILLYIIIGMVVQRCSVERNERVEEHAPLDEAFATEISQRLEALFQAPQRLDTATIAIEVYDVASQTPIYSRHADRLAPPASCLKLLTAVAAMEYLGIHHRYVEEVRLCGEQAGDVFYGTVVMQLDDDPLFESLEPLAEALRRQGIRRIEGDVVLDLLREDTLKAHPTAATWDIPYSRLPILLKGRKRIEQDLRYFLQTKGITLHRNPLLADPMLQGLDPVEDAVFYHLALNRLATTGRTIYHHHTPLTDVLAPMLIHSSNIKADALYYHLDHVCDRIAKTYRVDGQWPQSLAAKVIEPMGDDPMAFVINDGSGLSPDNRLTVDFLVRLLAYAWEQEDMRRVLLDEALATPGHPTRHGSLLGRMTAPLYRNKIFVKTGTLTTIGLSSLAGYAQAQDDRWLIFAIINEDSPVAESRIFQDKVCRELVR